MKLTTLAIASIATLAVGVSGYPIFGADSVNCRSGPGTSYSIVRSYPRGHDVTLTCQTEGTDIFGNTIWDKTTDGCFVSDYYVQTGGGYVTARCAGSETPCPAPKSNQATVDLIAEFEGFRADVCM